MTDSFTFRPMVEAYYSDQAVRSAVDELVTKRSGEGHAPHFEWEEFGAYVDAWLAGQQTAAEWALDLYDLWDRVWGEELKGRCRIVPRPSAIGRNIAMTDIHKAWFEGWYSRVVDTRHGSVGLVVYGGNENFYLQLEFAKKAPRLDLPGWTRGEDEIDGPKVRISQDSATACLDLTELRGHANRALELLALA